MNTLNRFNCCFYNVYLLFHTINGDKFFEKEDYKPSNKLYQQDYFRGAITSENKFTNRTCVTIYILIYKIFFLQSVSMYGIHYCSMCSLLAGNYLISKQGLSLHVRCLKQKWQRWIIWRNRKLFYDLDTVLQYCTILVNFSQTKESDILFSTCKKTRVSFYASWLIKQCNGGQISNSFYWSNLF